MNGDLSERMQVHVKTRISEMRDEWKEIKWAAYVKTTDKIVSENMVLIPNTFFSVILFSA